MRVLTIADIADPSGEFIPDGMLTGEWQAGSDMFWPFQVCPPSAFWSTFRRCLRLTFCTSTPPNQPIENGMDLDTHLGAWLPVKRFVWFDAYRSETTVYWREDTIIYEMTPSTPRGYYTRGPPISELPLDAHPISVHKVGNRVWTHRPYRMGPPTPSPSDPVGYVIRDTLPISYPLLIVCSDASTHLDTGVTTCAWVISATANQSKAMCANIQNVSSLTSYRGELEGLYRALRSALDYRSDSIQLWCDNKAAIGKATPHRTTPGMMIQSDSDVILAIQALVREYTGQILFHHVYGHQDTRNRGNTDRPQLTLPARLNIECDRLANETASAVHGQEMPLPTLQPPYPGTKALLRINGRWITSNEKQHISWATHRDNLWTYCREKYNWSEAVMETIMWSVLKKARTGRTLPSMIRTSKVLHGWLPVMHMHGRVTGSTQCPGCENPDETFEHLLQCRHERMQITRAQAIIKVRESGIKQGLPAGFMAIVQQYLRAILTDSEEEIDSEVGRMMEFQQEIGHMMAVKGYLSYGWLRLLRSYDSHQPERRLARLIRIIWDDLIDPIWTTRNDILHHHTNYVSEGTHAQLGDRLIWYTQHREELSRSDQFLTWHTLGQIEAMSSNQRREWVRHLDVARAAWATERAVLATGQRIITQYFSPKTQSG